MFTQETLETKTGPELVEIFNGIEGTQPVKRFTNREVGIRRILAVSGTVEAVDKSLEGTGLASLGIDITKTEVVSEPAKRGRKKEPRGIYNLTGGELKRSYRANSFRGRLLAILTADGATFADLQAQFPDQTEDVLHGTIKMTSRWLGFDVTTNDSGIIRASR